MGKILLAACAMLLLGGCAAREQLAVDRGAELVAAAEPAMGAARTHLRTVEATSRRAAVELAVVDRSCNWPTPRIPADPRQNSHPQQLGKLCSVEAAERAAQAMAAQGGAPFLKPVAFRPVGGKELEPTLRLIGGMTAYLEAVDAVVSADPDGSAAILDMALKDAEAIAAIAAGLTGTDELTLLTKDQGAAATGLAGLIGEFQQRRGQAAELERLVREDKGKFDASIDALERSLDNWSKLVLEADLDTIDAVFGRRFAKLRPTADDASYRSFLEEWQVLGAEREAAARGMPPALRQALAATREAHRQYVNILLDETLTPENRRAKARIAREQFSRSLGAVANILRAFG
jgi:hypothetical protein